MKKKLAELLNVIFGFRKFILMLLLVMIAVVFRVLDLLNGREMVDLLQNTTIAFFSANGIEHIVGIVKDYVNKNNQQNQEVADTDETNDEQEIATSEAKNG